MSAKRNPDDESVFLYRYMSYKQEYFDDIIDNHRLHISRLKTLNDHWEQVLDVVDWRTGRKFEEDCLKNRMNREFGLISYTTNDSCPYMWHEYADNLHGFVLEFCFPKDAFPGFHRVKYGDIFVKTDSEEFAEADGEALENLEVAAVEYHLSKKEEKWRREDEWRQIFSLSNVIKDNDEYFYTFTPTWLRRIIVGFCMESSDLSHIREKVSDSGDIRNVELLRSGVTHESAMKDVIQCSGKSMPCCSAFCCR